MYWTMEGKSQQPVINAEKQMTRENNMQYVMASIEIYVLRV